LGGRFAAFRAPCRIFDRAILSKIATVAGAAARKGRRNIIIVEAEIEAGVKVARHTHPGIESGCVLEGSLSLPIQGRETLSLKPGDAFRVLPGTPHAGGAASATKVHVASPYVVQKGKPLASPA
jgi:quercetin dioxygenase-like cupin family protein